MLKNALKVWSFVVPAHILSLYLWVELTVFYWDIAPETMTTVRSMFHEVLHMDLFSIPGSYYPVVLFYLLMCYVFSYVLLCTYNLTERVRNG